IDRLHPTEDLLDALSLPLADGIALVTRRSPIQPGGASAFDLGQVRRDVTSSEPSDEAFVVVALVAAQGADASAGLAAPIQHRDCRLGFAQRPIRDPHITPQPV